MLGKMQMFALISVLVLGGSAATVTMAGDSLFGDEVKPEIIFGPVTCERTEGEPDLYQYEFEAKPGMYVMRVENNDVNHAWIYLNGEEIAGPDDFNKNAEELELRIYLEEMNIMEVKLASETGSSLEISIISPPHRELVKKDVFKVHLAEVEALYVHEVYLLISSDGGKPIWGFVELIPPRDIFRDHPEDDRDDMPGEHDPEGDDEGSSDEGADDMPEEHDAEEDEGTSEEERDTEGDEGFEGEHNEDLSDEESDFIFEHERWLPRPKVFTFEFEHGKGELLLFPNSHKFLGFSAIVTVFHKEKVMLVPFIFVRNTEVYIFPDSVDDEGNSYCLIEEFDDMVRYGFEDLKDSPDFECDWDYNDVVLHIGRLPKKERHHLEGRAYTLSVRWGQLDGFNEEHEEMIPWNGSIFVGDGAVVLIEPLLFDYGGDYDNGGDDLIYERVSKNEIQWRASTTVHWDGILVLIIVPEGHKETHVAIHTEQWSGVFDEDDLPGLHERFEVNDLEDEIEINGWKGKVGPDCHHEKKGGEHESNKEP